MIDIIIILIILMCLVVGYKRGFIKELVSYLGFFLTIVISFVLKNYLSSFMYEHFPFIKFSGLFKGITSMNILLYEIVSFLIILSILLIIIRVLLFASSVLEKLFKLTIVLSIPSKILGLIVGLIEGITWSFIILYIINIPILNINNNSLFKDKILNNTPILTNMTKETTTSINEIEKLKDDYENKKISNNDFELESLDIMLKHKIINIKSLKRLVKTKKINIKNINKVIERYE